MHYYFIVTIDGTNLYLIQGACYDSRVCVTDKVGMLSGRSVMMELKDLFFGLEVLYRFNGPIDKYNTT